MQLKYPKRIKVLSMEFDVIYDKKDWGGSVIWEERKIVIGTASLKAGDQSSVFDTICHEVMEIVANITNTSHLDRGTTWDHKFVMDHKQFQTNIAIFSSVIQNFIK